MLEEALEFIGFLGCLGDGFKRGQGGGLAAILQLQLLFISRAGRRLSGSLVYQQVSRHLQSAGLAGKLKRCGAHVLRHTAASVMFARGVPILQIKENLGHEDLATTQIYAHLLPPEGEAM